MLYVFSFLICIFSTRVLLFVIRVCGQNIYSGAERLQVQGQPRAAPLLHPTRYPKGSHHLCIAATAYTADALECVLPLESDFFYSRDSRRSRALFQLPRQLHRLQKEHQTTKRSTVPIVPLTLTRLYTIHTIYSFLSYYFYLFPLFFLQLDASLCDCRWAGEGRPHCLEKWEAW